jgi:hypothetical protein
MENIYGWGAGFESTVNLRPVRLHSAGFSPRKLGFAPGLVHPCEICGGKRGIGTAFAASPSVLSVSANPPLLVYTRVPCGGCTVGPLAAHFHTDIICPQCNNKKKRTSPFAGSELLSGQRVR